MSCSMSLPGGGGRGGNFRYSTKSLPRGWTSLVPGHLPEGVGIRRRFSLKRKQSILLGFGRFLLPEWKGGWVPVADSLCIIPGGYRLISMCFAFSTSPHDRLMKLCFTT